MAYRFILVSILVLTLVAPGAGYPSTHPMAAGAVPGRPAEEILEGPRVEGKRSGTSFTPTIDVNPVYDTIVGFAYFRSLPEKPGFEYGTSLNFGTKDGESFVFHYDKWLNRDRLYQARLSYSTFFDPYYGEGNDTDKDSEVQIDGTKLLLQVFRKSKFGDSFTFGPYLDLRSREEDGVDDDPSVRSGLPDETSVGLGLSLVYDTRDSAASPTWGKYAEFRLLFVPDVLTSLDIKDGFGVGEVDIRSFDSLRPGWIIGGRFHAGFSLGDSSYLFRHTLGGPDDLRGYLFNRFRGNHFYLVQWETRFSLFWVITGAVFAGLGDVADDSFDNPKWSAGFGFRAALPPDWIKKARMDIAWSEDQRAVRFVFGEAF